MPRNYNNGRLVVVTIAGFPNLRYGFNTRVRESTSTTLGHVSITPGGLADVNGIVLGANSPKPPRASKRLANGYEGSFADKSKIAELKGDGWRITRGKTRKGSSSARSKTVYITINGINYAWNRPEAATMPDLSQTGHEEPDSNTPLVFGARFPKPPRMKLERDDGDFATFIKANQATVDALKEAGWTNAGNGTYTLKDFKDIA